MRRTLLGILWILIAGSAACDNGAQRRLIETYRGAEFASSLSHVTRDDVTLTTTFGLGRAYRVTSRRIEYVPVSADEAPPVDDRGELVGVKILVADDPDEEVEEGSSRPAGGVLTVQLPSKVLRSSDLYYRWVVEYTSGAGRLTMRKSEIFRTRLERSAPEAQDESFAQQTVR